MNNEIFMGLSRHLDLAETARRVGELQSMAISAGQAAQAYRLAYREAAVHLAQEILRREGWSHGVKLRVAPTWSMNYPYGAAYSNCEFGHDPHDDMRIAVYPLKKDGQPTKAALAYGPYHIPFSERLHLLALMPAGEGPATC